jgi:hypothetical protein
MTNDICKARVNTCICHEYDEYRSLKYVECHNNYKDECSCIHKSKPGIFDTCSCNRKCILDNSKDRTREVINSLLYSAFKRGGIDILCKYSDLLDDEHTLGYDYVLSRILDENSDTTLDVLKPIFDTQDKYLVYQLYFRTFNKTTNKEVLTFTLDQIQSNIEETFKFHSNNHEEEFMNMINSKTVKLIDIYLSSDKGTSFYVNLLELMDILINNESRVLVKHLKSLDKRDYNKPDSTTLDKPINRILFIYLCRSKYCDKKCISYLSRSKHVDIPLFKKIILFDPNQ